MSTKAPNVEPLFTVKTLTEYLGLGERTVRRMIATGELPSYKLKGQRRVRPRDVERWIDQHRAHV